MHRKQSQRSRAKCLKNRKGCMSSVKGVSHLSRRAKRRLYCKLQLWMWRRRREKCRFGMYRTKKQAYLISPVKTQSQLDKIKLPAYHKSHLRGSQLGTSCMVEESLRRHNNELPETLPAASTNNTVSEFSKMADPPEHPHTVQPAVDSDVSTLTPHFKERRTAERVQRCDDLSGPGAALTPAQNKVTSGLPVGTGGTKISADVSLKVLTRHIHAFLEEFHRTYGSFIPLQKTDVLRHLKKRLNTDFSDRKNLIFPEVNACRTAFSQKPVPSFRVVYKKHTLTLEDMSTLADQNWLNDQVMNMYGELIMASSDHKVHFLNSFFHRQLMTKGYDGVKRWTKQVDLFSKRLLLVPIHLEVHWCLVAADFLKKKISLYDSQGNALQKVARNILKYLMTEAKEKKRADFESGWAVSFDEKVPQQTNENDCGVFVLEYSRCLALAKPLQFSQKDIPKIRKRIYKELCDCRLREQS